MTKKLFAGLILVLVFGLSACMAQPTAMPTILPTTPVTSTAVVITSTLPPLPTVKVTVETATPQATSIGTPGGLPDISDSVYLDDRSTPAALMLSYFNAINRHEYLRAYSYYGDPAQLGSLDQFSSGYSETKSVNVLIAPISNGGAAGSIYFTVPMVLKAVTTAGAEQKFAACYLLRLPQPGNYAAPPITPMHIDRGTAEAVAVTTQDSAVLASACASPEFSGGPNPAEPAVEDLSDLSAANFIDNRSDAVALMSSYVNAINLKEYVRAFSYWETPPGGYESFAAGFADTASVMPQFGQVTSDPGAGQLYYSLPVAFITTLVNGNAQTFVGCYTLHLSQPSIQGVAPFKPLGIRDGSVHLVDNSSDVTSLLTTACP